MAEGNAGAERVAFASVSLLLHGAEFTEAGYVSHIQRLNRLLSQGNPFWEYPHQFYHICLALTIAGRFEPDLDRGLGRACYYAKSRDILVRARLDQESFVGVSENAFRQTLAGLLTRCMDKAVALIRRKQLPIDVASLTSRWQLAVGLYLEEDLPLRSEPAKEQKPVTRPEAEYFFVFRRRGQRTSFLRAINSMGLSVETTEGDDEYLCTVTDEFADGIRAGIESTLIRLCEECGGEYDGWAV